MARRPTFVEIRTGVLFGAGLAGVVYETVVTQADRPTLLVLFAAMMGLPLFLKADEKSLQSRETPTAELPPAPTPAPTPDEPT